MPLTWRMPSNASLSPFRVIRVDFWHVRVMSVLSVIPEVPVVVFAGSAMIQAFKPEN